MSIIKILPENLVNQIAAGEVVERPASVVKELVENSLDSGAKEISIEVREGGKSLIRVIDDGKGMSADDLQMAIQRHATSKIAAEGDLWNIASMGFRGEALASIASIAKLTIKSRQAETNAGNEIQVEGGDVSAVVEVGINQGTQIEVAELFYNTPARKKYLKKDSTELSHITSLLNSIALAHPEVAIKLVHNDRTVFDYPRVSDLISRINDVFGKATAEAMIPIFYGGSEVQIDGFIGKPLLSRSTSQHQYFFVNGRPIQHFVLAKRIKDAYYTMLMEHKKPVFIINIKIDPALVDVNVHPRKLEVRFEDQKSIMSIVYGCVKTALEKSDLMPKGFSESRNYMSDNFPKTEVIGVESTTPRTENFSFRPNFGSGSSTGAGSGAGSSTGFAARSLSAGGSFGVQDAIDFSTQMAGRERSHEGLHSEEKPKIKAITQVANSYIVAENEDGLVLIDQHAAHEKVRFEELMDQYENQEKSVQSLLVPMNVEFSADELIMVKENMEIFDSLGFEIEAFGGNTYIVRAVPSCLAKQELDDVIKGVLDDIKAGKMATKLQGKVEEVLTYMSCRTAIKFGQSLSLPEMQILLDKTVELKRPFTCPHGRPTMVSLNFDELERMFGRK